MAERTEYEQSLLNDPLLMALAGAIETRLREPQIEDEEPLDVTAEEIALTIGGQHRVPSDQFWEAFDFEVDHLTGRFLETRKFLKARKEGHDGS